MKKEILVRQYSEDFKKMVVGKIENGEISLRGAMRKYNIGGSETLYRWKAKYGKIQTKVKYQLTSLDHAGDVVVSGG